MSRSINQIQNSIISDIVNDSTLGAELTSTSRVAYWRLWVYITAKALAEEEVNNDIFLADVEDSISSNPPATSTWIQRYVLAFQYSASSPQSIQLDTTTLVPYYPVVDDNLKIITRVSIVTPYVNDTGVVEGTPGAVLIKVAKESVPVALSTAELSAFQNYLNIIKPAGIIYKAVSENSDKLFVEVNIYYRGSYSSIIKTSVYNAYIDYIANLPFDGVVKTSDIEVALRTVTGVTDVLIRNVNYRRDSAIFSPGVYNMTSEYTQIRKDASELSLAGYVNDETTTGYSFLEINDGNFIAT